MTLACSSSSVQQFCTEATQELLSGFASVQQGEISIPDGAPEAHADVCARSSDLPEEDVLFQFKAFTSLNLMDLRSELESKDRVRNLYGAGGAPTREKRLPRRCIGWSARPPSAGR